MDTLEKLLTLTPGNKYTVVGMGEFGFPYQFQITLIDVFEEKYAQYDSSYRLTFKLPRKQLARQVRFYGSRPVIVWDGWVSPNTNMYPSKYMTPDGVQIRKSFSCFDDRYMEIARESVPQAPVVEVYKKPVFNPAAVTVNCFE